LNGSEETIEDPELVARLRAKARRIHVLAVGFGLAATVFTVHEVWVTW